MKTVDDIVATAAAVYSKAVDFATIVTRIRKAFESYGIRLPQEVLRWPELLKRDFPNQTIVSGVDKLVSNDCTYTSVSGQRFTDEWCLSHFLIDTGFRPHELFIENESASLYPISALARYLTEAPYRNLNRVMISSDECTGTLEGVFGEGVIPIQSVSVSATDVNVRFRELANMRDLVVAGIDGRISINDCNNLQSCTVGLLKCKDMGDDGKGQLRISEETHIDDLNVVGSMDIYISNDSQVGTLNLYGTKFGGDISGACRAIRIFPWDISESDSTPLAWTPPMGCLAPPQLHLGCLPVEVPESSCEAAAPNWVDYCVGEISLDEIIRTGVCEFSTSVDISVLASAALGTLDYTSRRSISLPEMSTYHDSYFVGYDEETKMPTEGHFTSASWNFNFGFDCNTFTISYSKPGPDVIDSISEAQFPGECYYINGGYVRGHVTWHHTWVNFTSNHREYKIKNPLLDGRPGTKFVDLVCGNITVKMSFTPVLIDAKTSDDMHNYIKTVGSDVFTSLDKVTQASFGVRCKAEVWNNV